jgi:hypothetical protein
MDLEALPLLGFVIALILLLAKLIYTSSPPAPSKRLPPGPWQLPLVGSLHHILLSRHGALPHRALRELSGRHGPLMLLRFGAVPTLVVSSAEGAQEVLKTHDAAFASRYLTPTLAIFSRGGEDILFSPYSDLWRQLRKICVLELLSARRVQSFRHIREDEAAALLRSVADECAQGAGGSAVVEIGKRMSRMVTDIVVRSAVGSRCPRRDEFLRELDIAGKLTGGFNLADLYPSSPLARWISGAIRETERCNRDVRDIMADIIRGRADGGEGGSEEDEEDLLGVLLRLQKEGGVQCPLTAEIITTFVMVSYHILLISYFTQIQAQLSQQPQYPNDSRRSSRPGARPRRRHWSGPCRSSSETRASSARPRRRCERHSTANTG